MRCKIYVILIIFIIAIVGYALYRRIRCKKDPEEIKESDPNAHKAIMRYITELNKRYVKLRSTSTYKEEYYEDGYIIDTEFRNSLTKLAESLVQREDIKDIQYCMGILNEIYDIRYDLHMSETIKLTEYLRMSYRKFKDILSKDVDNMLILNPLCILLAVYYGLYRNEK